MTDMTMCDNNNCENKEECLRFTATPDEYTQSYFHDPTVQCKSFKYFVSNMKWLNNSVQEQNEGYQ